MKIAMIDLETTGLSPTKNEIIEIGMVIFDSETHQILEEWDAKIKPLYPDQMDPKALKVNGYNEEDWRDANDVIPVLMEFIEKTRGCTFMAYNASFDIGFLEYQLEKYEMKHEMDHHKICLMSMAYAIVPHNKVFSWGLRTVGTYLGVVPEPKVHRGANGAKKGYEVYCKLMQI